MTVRRRADPDGEQAIVAQSFVDRREELRLVADGPVGQEDHLPKPAGMLARVERLPERWQHLGAAVGAEPADVAIGEGQVLHPPPPPLPHPPPPPPPPP